MNDQEIVLEWRIKYSYGLGHVLNDLAAAVWFTYNLLFYKLIFESNAFAFIVTGQVFDSVVTILIGVYFDGNYTKRAFFRLGKYKTWYLIGLMLLLLSFPVCFAEIPFVISSQLEVICIFVFAICVSQIGWSFCQIAHLSLINELSVTGADRVWMTSVRQAASIYAAIAVYGLFWYTLKRSGTASLAKADIIVFANNTFFLAGYGLVHSVVFILALRENELVHRKEHLMLVRAQAQLDLSQSKQVSRRPMDDYAKLDWFKDVTFYKISFIYMLARLFLNMHLSYVPLYLQATLFLPKASIAIVPMIIYVSGFISSFFSNIIESKFSNKLDLLFGIIFGIIASLWTSLGSCRSESFINYQIYAIAVLFGISTSIVKISTISLVADMIGQNTQSTSFVYGAVSCVEKVVGGVVIGLLEHFNPDTSLLQSENVHCSDHNLTQSGAVPLLSASSVTCGSDAHPVQYYHYIMSYGNAVILFLILLGLCSIASVKLNKA